jgi:VanZ family protein
VAWAALIFYLSSRSVVPEPPGGEAIPFLDKLEHALEYGIFSALLMLALRRGPVGPAWRLQRHDPLLAFTIAALYAFSDEVHQAFVPMRLADPGDLIVDALGAAVVAFLLSPYLTSVHPSAHEPAARPTERP